MIELSGSDHAPGTNSISR